MSKKLKPTLKNCRSYHSAEIGSDHSIVIENIDVKKSKKYNYTKKDLQDVTTMIKYKMERHQRNLQQNLKNG